MTTAVWAMIGVWLGCLAAEWQDGFRSTRRLVREMRRQWAWAPRLARRLASR
jgi:hypothetical protein